LAASNSESFRKKIWFDDERLDDIKEAITKQDVKDLIGEGVIRAKPMKSISKGRTRVAKIQKAKGHRAGHGSRKGKKTARLSKKDSWMAKIRVQRKFLKSLREKALVTKSVYHNLYRKAKGGFFRSTRHLKLYAEENELFNKKEE